MTTQEYILSELEKLKTPATVQDIGDIPIEEAILAKVMSKKFRKVKADQPAIDTAKQAIKIAVKENEPVRLMLFFGGNKLWRLNEAPEIDWGELFSLMYYANWAKYIASVYKPGAVIEYFSMDVAVERMNNVPRAEADQYADGMYKLLEWFQQYTPDGVHIKYTRMGDLYENREAFLKEMDESKDAWLKNNGGNLPNMNEAQNIATELNVRLQPRQDDDPLWREKTELEHKAIFGTKIGGAYMSDPSMIPHCPTWYSGFIATGSTKRSIAKFWAGVGALESSVNGYSQLILTPKQLESASFEWQDLHIDGLSGKNFNKIRVL